MTNIIIKIHFVFYLFYGTLLISSYLTITIRSDKTMQKDTRRRGDTLQIQIYEATYYLLEKDGYNHINFSKIAKQAHTSRSVLYRYWDQLFDLVLETILYEIKISNNVLTSLEFDLGSLEKNLMFVGKEFIKQSTRGANRHFKILFGIANSSQNIQLKKIIAYSRTANLKIMDYILQLAISKHEIKVLPSETVKLAYFDLLRYNSWTLDSDVTIPVIEKIVREVTLPSILAFSNEK